MKEVKDNSMIEEKLLKAAISVKRVLTYCNDSDTHTALLEDMTDSLESLLEVVLEMNGYKENTTYNWSGYPIVDLSRKEEE